MLDLFDIKHLISIVALGLLLVLYLLQKRHITVPLFVAVFVAAAWTGYFRYEYIGDNIFLFNRINVYPFVLWVLGLTSLYALHHKVYRHSALMTLPIYFFGLAAAEAVGYHILSIRLASNYTSLLGLGIIHAPIEMKFFYVLAGPAYLLLVHWLENKVEASKK